MNYCARCGQHLMPNDGQEAIEPRPGWRSVTICKPCADEVRKLAAAVPPSPYPQPSTLWLPAPQQIERLALLSEEAGEVQLTIGKVLRHGWESWKPSNRAQLATEISDVLAAIMLIVVSTDLNQNAPTNACDTWVDLMQGAVDKFERFSESLLTKTPLVHYQGTGILTLAKQLARESARGMTPGQRGL